MNLDDMFATNDTQSVDNKLDAQRAIKKLGHIDRAILYLWCAGYNQTEIGDIFGLSQGRISQILSKINNSKA